MYNAHPFRFSKELCCMHWNHRQYCCISCSSC